MTTNEMAKKLQYMGQRLEDLREQRKRLRGDIKFLDNLMGMIRRDNEEDSIWCFADSRRVDKQEEHAQILDELTKLQKRYDKICEELEPEI